MAQTPKMVNPGLGHSPIPKPNADYSINLLLLAPHPYLLKDSTSKSSSKKKGLSTLLSKLVAGYSSGSDSDSESEVTNPYMLGLDFSTKAGRDRFNEDSK